MGEPLISIVCEVFNHEPYLRQCLKGFVMQETTFPFEILIHDDASTDGSAAIIREYEKKYPHLFRPIYQTENQYSKGVLIWGAIQFPRARGKYIATCEGDDYWIDPLKLQKQVDFLEAHPKFGFVGSMTHILTEQGIIMDDVNRLPSPQGKEGNWDLFYDIIDYAKCGPVTKTVSLCFRKSIIEPFLSYICGDVILQTILAKHSFFAMSDETMAVYRYNVGVSSNKSLEKQLAYNEWFITNRRIQKQLFPYDCNWDENELLDRKDYIRLKMKIRDKEWKEALAIKKDLRTSTYRRKTYAKFLQGPVSCLLLSSSLRK